jgi:hypothetical protein
MVKRFALACALALGLALSLSAQIIDTQLISATSADCSTASSCAVFNIGSASSLSITVTGTFTATLILEGSADGGVSWVTVQGTNVVDGSATTAPTAGVTVAVSNVGYLKVRVRASAWSSGTAKVVATRGYAHSARVGGGGSGSGGYSNLIQVDANTLAERNATTPQNWFVTQTYTDASNYKQLQVKRTSTGTIWGDVWDIRDSNIVAGSENSTGTGIQVSAKNVTLFDYNNNNYISVTNAGSQVNGTLNFKQADGSYRVSALFTRGGEACWSSTTNGDPMGTANSACFGQSYTDPGVLMFKGTDVGGTSGPTTGTWMAGRTDAKPTCDVTRRGMYWHFFAAAGSTDTVEVCAKDAANAYAWHALY